MKNLLLLFSLLITLYVPGPEGVIGYGRVEYDRTQYKDYNVHKFSGVLEIYMKDGSTIKWNGLYRIDEAE